MKVSYDDKSDLLYIRLDESRQDVVNRRVGEDVVLDIGEVQSSATAVPPWTHSLRDLTCAGLISMIERRMIWKQLKQP